MSSQAPGHLVGSMKWLVPRYPLPQGKLLFLGSILSDPENPETSLNWRSGSVAVPTELKLDGTMAVRQQVYSELCNNTSALIKAVPPNSPLFSAGVKLEGKKADEVKTTVNAMHIEAEYFIPDKAYMDLALAQKEIVTYAKDCAFSKSLFIVVGVATAGELTIQEDTTRERSAGLGAHASVTGTGVEGEAEFSAERAAKGGGTLTVAQPCEFAYRVRRFDYSKLFRKFKDKGDRTDGAMFGGDRKKEEEDAGGEYLPAFVELDDEDICQSENFIFNTTD